MKYKIDISDLKRMYLTDLMLIDKIAEFYGCSVANIKRLLKKHKITRGRVLQKQGLVKSWNKGLTKDSNEVLKRLSEERVGDKNPMFNMPAWNKGLTKDNNDSLKTVSLKMTDREVGFKTREKQALAKLGKTKDLANNWQGGRAYINRLGYLQYRFTIDGKRWYAHRYVATKALGRDLRSDEEVHHIDAGRINNSPENLLVLNENDHNRLHRAIDSGHITKRQQIDWLILNGINFEVCDGKNKVDEKYWNKDVKRGRGATVG